MHEKILPPTQSLLDCIIPVPVVQKSRDIQSALSFDSVFVFPAAHQSHKGQWQIIMHLQGQWSKQ